ncbi:MAG: adenylate kinase [Verrucomicrobiota bacterium]
MNAIILLGPPGAGKGTLAESLKDETDFIHVSTGDMLRAAIKAESPVGLEAKAFMEKGELVPDSVILGIIKERIAQAADTARFMFDGFPRTLEQAKGLDQLLAEIGGTLLNVVNMSVPDDILIRRLSGRRLCKTCGAVYHVINVPPKTEGICDNDGAELYQRPDDNEETVRNRLSVYENQTAPLISYYREQGLILDVDASITPENTCALTLEALNG